MDKEYNWYPQSERKQIVIARKRNKEREELPWKSEEQRRGRKPKKSILPKWQQLHRAQGPYGRRDQESE